MFKDVLLEAALFVPALAAKTKKKSNLYMTSADQTSSHIIYTDMTCQTRKLSIIILSETRFAVKNKNKKPGTVT